MHDVIEEASVAIDLFVCCDRVVNNAHAKKRLAFWNPNLHPRPFSVNDLHGNAKLGELRGAVIIRRCI